MHHVATIERVIDLIDPQRNVFLNMHGAEAESRVKSALVIKGFHIQAADGDLGHVDDFFIDDQSWQVRYLRIDTSNWIGGKPVLVPPVRARRVKWLEGQIQFDLSRDQIASSPKFDPAVPITPEFEIRLQQHYHSPTVASR